MTDNIIKEKPTENGLENKLEYTNFKAFAGLILTGAGAYLIGTELPPEVATHQMKAYQMLSYGLTAMGLGLSINAMQRYNDIIKKK
ncbi:MAG TPA: hypothetical protein VJG31_01905 [Candidatus Nanoarchaeia archaeon]|nr:hypothetical protein [Candidatus Nanoarchaeia archaeon]